MYVEAIKWAMGLIDADVTPQQAPSPSVSLKDVDMGIEK
jgi:hypothetical protein